jgi:hypothetical protein
MDPETGTRTSKLQRETADALAAAAAPGWSEVVLTVSATVLAYDFAATVRLADGRNGDIELPDAVKRGFPELRELMYEPGRGTWFSVRLTLRAGTEPGYSFDYDFNYDEDPKWSPPLAPTAFCRDLEAFPREDEHIPAWLREVLAEGEALERDHRAGLG